MEADLNPVIIIRSLFCECKINFLLDNVNFLFRFEEEKKRIIKLKSMINCFPFVNSYFAQIKYTTHCDRIYDSL